MKFEQAKFNCPQHTGIAAEIRAALERAGEPLSVYKLFLATGILPKKIKSSIGTMIGRTGGVVSLSGPNGIVYALLKPKSAPTPNPSRPGQIAGRITIPQYRWGATRLG